VLRVTALSALAAAAAAAAAAALSEPRAIPSHLLCPLSNVLHSAVKHL
jgi:hypothetical protein